MHLTYYCGPDAALTEKQAKTDRKQNAVKNLKIGGKDSDILFDPSGNSNPIHDVRVAMMKEQFAKVREVRAKAKAAAQAGPKKLKIGGFETEIDFAPAPKKVGFRNGNRLRAGAEKGRQTAGRRTVWLLTATRHAAAI